MSRSLDDFSKRFYDIDYNIQYSGVAYIPSLKAKTYQYTVVYPNEAFRPDIIALRILGDQNLSWILDEINGFEHGIKEYTMNREIKYLKPSTIETAGIYL